MGIPVDKPSYVCGDNMSVVTNVSRPELMLKKKMNLICYHAVCEAIVMGEVLVAHIPTKKNMAVHKGPVWAELAVFGGPGALGGVPST